MRAAATPPAVASYTPKHLAEKILTLRAALKGERKQVTVLFADLRGSIDMLALRDPEDAPQSAGVPEDPRVAGGVGMGRYADALRWLGIQDWFTRVFKPFFPKPNRSLYRRSGGRLTAAGPMMFPTLLLTTTGH